MEIIKVTWQAVFQEAQAFGRLAMPVIGFVLFFLVTWSVSRFWAKHQEQRDIKRHMPEIIQKEIKTRDARINKLESELTTVRAAYMEARALLRLIENRCDGIVGKIRETIPAPRLVREAVRK